MSFYVTDAEIFEHLEHKAATQGLWTLTPEERELRKILRRCKVAHCGLCGAPVRHYVESEFYSDGVSRFLKISCQNAKCGFSFRGIQFDDSWRDVEADYIEHCEQMKQCILSHLKETK